jgi:cell volume regulation protein A
VITFLFFSFGLGVVAAVIWSHLLRFMEDTLTTIMSTMGMLIILYLFAEMAGANGAVTLFFFAIILSNISLLGKMMYKKEKSKLTMLDQETKDFFRAVSFILRTFLFIYLGILADLSQWPLLLFGAALFVIAYLLRSFIGGFIHNREISKREQCLSDAMCAKGFTAAVLLPLIPGLGVFSNVIIGGIFASIVISSIMLHLIQKDRFSSANSALRGLAHRAKK